MMFFWSVLFGVLLAVNHVSGGFRTCKSLKDAGVHPNPEDGIYTLVDSCGYEYQAFCDMTTDGGGWTMVASVHENNCKGRCTVDDLWSSQQGKLQPEGDGNWNSRVTFGDIEGATSGDYKNAAYYDSTGVSNIAVWHVPNIKRPCDWKTSAYLRYRTTCSSFSESGLYTYFTDNPLVRDESDTTCKKGKVLQVTFDEGDGDTVKNLFGSLVQAETDTGYVTLGPRNSKGVPFAICPGLRAKTSSTACSFQHYCIGGGGFHSAVSDSGKICGDFNALDGKGDGQAGWIAANTLRESTMIIFYK